MDQVLRALGGLLLNAIPTFVLVIALHFYLKRVYFRPMARVLAERAEATEGARRQASDMLAQASAKAAEYDENLRNARSEIYREQEQYRDRLRQDQAQALTQARESSNAAVKQATARLAEEAALARQSLAAQADSLANEIVQTILHRRAA
jgi:F-type H+-transporting ATPase subunit b